MGWFDRIHDAVTGLGNALEAPVGFVKDVATSGTDSRGMIDGIYHDFIDRTGQALGGAIGPTGFTGSLIGGLPEGARQGINEFVKPTENTMDLAYTDLIGRPLSTLATATAEDQAGHGGFSGGLFNGKSWSNLFSGQHWADAWDQSAHRSPGQAIALAFMTKDITNPTQVAKAQGSDFYSAATGLTDGALRWFGDPTQHALAGSTEYLKGLHVVDSQAAINALTRDGTLGRFADRVMEHAGEQTDPNLLAADIRDRYFPKSYLGAQHATILADAAAHGGAPEVEQALRVLLGSTSEIESVRAANAANAGQMDRLMQRREMVSQTDAAGWMMNNTPDDLARQDAEINARYDEGVRNQRLDNFSASMQEVPHQSAIGQARSALTHTDWYQNGIMSKPLRVVFQQGTQHLIQYDSPMSDATLFHFLQSSDLPLDTQLAMRGAYLNAGTNGERMAIKNAAVDRAIASIADSSAVLPTRKFGTWLSNAPKLDEETAADLTSRYQAAKGRDARFAVMKEAANTSGLPLPGLSVDEMNQHLAEYAQNRDQTYQMLNGRKYDGIGRSTVAFEDENGIANHLVLSEKPLYETQLADLDSFPDLRKYRSVSTYFGRLRGEHPSLDMPTEVAKMFNDVWKPATVLRPAMATRIVSDEALRVAAKVGALNAAKFIGSGAKDMVQDTAAYALGKVGIDWEKSSRGMEPFIVNGHALEGAYGLPGDGANIYKTLNHARDQYGRDIVTAEGGIYDDLKKSGDWVSHTPTDPLYGTAWQRDVNLQIGQSALGRHVVEAKLQGLDNPSTIADAARWLRSTPEGQNVARNVGRTNYEEWAHRVTDQVNAYLPTDTLKQAAISQTAHEQMLHDEFARAPEAFPNGQLPIVHGEVLKQDLGTSPVTAFVKNLRDGLYSNMVDKPDSYLIRDPFYDHLYQQEARRRIQVLTGEKEYTFAERMIRRAAGLPEQSPATNFALTQADLDNIMYGSRQYALGEVKNLLHNFSEQSRLGEMLRYVAPFYSAWQQIFTRWSGIAAENPAFIRRMDMLWRAPERAGVVTDGKGNLLDENDNISHAVVGGPWKNGDPAADNQRNITLSIPKWAKDVPVVGGVAGQQLRFGKDSLNLLLHGLPSVGPLVQLPINEIAKSRPDLEESLKWALPYGVKQHSLDILKPSILQHASQQIEGDSNRPYAYTVMQLFNDRVVDFNRGIRATPPTWAEAEKDAKSLEHVKFLAQLGLPMTPQFISPYQPYIDSYRARLDYDGTLTPQQKQDPAYQTPKEWFLKTYGPEFFPLTTSMSKSIDGVPPTLEGFAVRQQYQDLIGKYPELGSLIVGQTGAGSFSGAVYDSQFQTRTSPGGPKERQVQPYADFQSAPATELGWTYFGKAMDMLDALRIQRNLPSFNVHGAADLKAMKQNLVYNLAVKYPSWFEAYASTDSTKWDQRIQGMTAISRTPGMTARPEMTGLESYLSARRELVGALDEAKSHNLGAAHNAGLAQQWDNYVQDLVAHNPAFGALFHRWLENDPVTITPITDLAGAGTLNSTGPLGPAPVGL